VIAKSTPAAKPSGTKFQFYALWLPLPGLALIGLGLGSRGSGRKRLLGLLLFWMALAGFIILPACGGGSSTTPPPSCSAAPGVPTGLAASGTTTSGTTLNWTAPTTIPANCSLTGYTVYQNGTALTPTTTNTTYNVTGLLGGTQYNFTVAASDSFGASAQTSAVSVSTGTQPQAYTITITGKDANGMAQTGAAATVAVTVN